MQQQDGCNHQGRRPCRRGLDPASQPRPGPGTCTGTQVEIWDNKSFYFATDHLGTVRAVYEGVTDATTGQKVLIPRSWHDYEPYGVELFPGSASDERHRFTG